MYTATLLSCYPDLQTVTKKKRICASLLLLVKKLAQKMAYYTN